MSKERTPRHVEDRFPIQLGTMVRLLESLLETTLIRAGDDLGVLGLAIDTYSHSEVVLVRSKHAEDLGSRELSVYIDLQARPTRFF